MFQAPSVKRAILYAGIVVVMVVSVVMVSGLVEVPGFLGGEVDEEPFVHMAEVDCRGMECNFSPTFGDNAPTNEPHIGIDPTNPLRVLAGSNDYTGPTGDSWVGYYWSDDGGKSWTRGLIPGYPEQGDDYLDCVVLEGENPLDGCFEGGGDAVVSWGPDGEAYMAGIAFNRQEDTEKYYKHKWSTIFVARSDDGGGTWPQITSLVSESRYGAQYFHDKEWMAVDRYTGDVHVCWSLFGTNRLPLTSQIVYGKSTDGGATFTSQGPDGPVVLSEQLQGEFQVQGCQIDVDMEGQVHVIWVDFARGQFRYARSPDRGETWEPVRSIAPVVAIPYQLPQATYRTPTLPAFFIHPGDTRTDQPAQLYGAWNDYSSGDSDIRLVRSLDGGDTWEGPFKVNDDNSSNATDQFFPALTVDESGRVHMLFYDRRSDPDNNKALEAWYAYSDDQGETWPQFVLSETPFEGNGPDGGSALVQNGTSPELIPMNGSRLGGLASSKFMGDYLGIAATSGGPGVEPYVIAIWTDTRNPESETGTRDWDNDLYVARIVQTYDD